MKEVRTRRGSDPEVDLEGPSGWSRGAAWDDEQSMHRASLSVDDGNTGARSR
jgi:hypothetical protein